MRCECCVQRAGTRRQQCQGLVCVRTLLRTPPTHLATAASVITSSRRVLRCRPPGDFDRASGTGGGGCTTASGCADDCSPSTAQAGGLGARRFVTQCTNCQGASWQALCSHMQSAAARCTPLADFWLLYDWVAMSRCASTVSSMRPISAKHTASMTAATLRHNSSSSV